jgi:hypothetical protein
VRVGARSTLGHVAVAVGDALRRAGIRAVLTGGACAHLYSGGVYQSLDADFVLTAPCSPEDLDRALASVGFRRVRDRYVHRGIPFFVEFPKGPLGIGEDFRIQPVWRIRGSGRTLALSATDACRDRLAAFYHWNDRQSLAAAVAIAARNRVAFGKVREWSRKEGHLKGYAIFITELRRVREAARSKTRGSRTA